MLHFVSFLDLGLFGQIIGSFWKLGLQRVNMIGFRKKSQDPSQQSPNGLLTMILLDENNQVNSLDCRNDD